ncbi:MAG: ABC transporter substrate-binding protein [Anaerolineae bacterium]|nr:ABC transporter substrate-binding protein [Anaerolineae bacterium]
MTRKILSKLLAFFLISILISVLAVACCPRPPEEDVEPTRRPSYDVEIYGELEGIDPSEQVIVFWHPYTQGQEELLLALIDQFNAGNEWGITIVGEYAGSSDALYDEILGRIESHALPDIVIAEQHQVAAYAAQGALIALDPYVESEAWGYKDEDLGDFFPIALNADRVPQFDDRYGWPFYLSMEVLYYNEDWLVELGYTEPPKTWADFAEMACAASDSAVGTYGYEFSVDALTFVDMLLNRGGQVFGEDAGAYVFDSEEGLATLTFIQDLLGRECAILKTERAGARTDFGAGRVLFTIGSISDLPQYRRDVAEGAGFNWSISRLPTALSEPWASVRGPSFSIFQSTPEKQLAAWLFLKWFTAPEQQARWARTFGDLSIRSSTADFLQDYIAENPRYDVALSFLDGEVAAEPGVVGYGECREAMQEMLSAIASRGEPAPWLADTARICDASLE